MSACTRSGPRPYFKREIGGYASKNHVVNKDVTSESTQPRFTANKETVTDVSIPSGSGMLQKTADSYLGVPYRYGGQTRKGIDCSGFIGLVYKQAFNMDLPRTATEIGKEGHSVSESSLKKGDIVLFGSLFGIHHAGIYMSDRKFIHASTSSGVIYSSLDEKYYQTKYKGARRVLN